MAVKISIEGSKGTSTISGDDSPSTIREILREFKKAGIDISKHFSTMKKDSDEMLTNYQKYIKKRKELSEKIVDQQMRIQRKNKEFEKWKKENYGSFTKMIKGVQQESFQREEAQRAILLKKVMSGEKATAKERMNTFGMIIGDINDKIADQQLTNWSKQVGFFKGLGNMFKGVIVDPFILAAKGWKKVGDFAKKTDSLMKGNWKDFFGEKETEEQQKLNDLNAIKETFNKYVEEWRNLKEPVKGEELLKATEEWKAYVTKKEELEAKGASKAEIRKATVKEREAVDTIRLDINKYKDKEGKVNIDEYKKKGSFTEKINFNKFGGKDGTTKALKSTASGIKGMKNSLVSKIGPAVSKAVGFLGQIVAVLAAFAGGVIIGTILKNALRVFWERHVMKSAFGKGLSFVMEKLVNFLSTSFLFNKPEYGPSGTEILTTKEAAKQYQKAGNKMQPDISGTSMVNDAFISKDGRVQPISNNDNILAFKRPTAGILASLNSEFMANNNKPSPINNNIEINNNSLSDKLDRMNTLLVELIEVNKQSLIPASKSKVVG